MWIDSECEFYLTIFVAHIYLYSVEAVWIDSECEFYLTIFVAPISVYSQLQLDTCSFLRFLVNEIVLAEIE